MSDPSHDHEDDYYDDMDEDEEERRHWKAKNGSKTINYAQADARPRLDSAATAALPPNRRPAEPSKEEQGGYAHAGTESCLHASSAVAFRRRAELEQPIARTAPHRTPQGAVFPILPDRPPSYPATSRWLVNVSIHRDRRRSRGGSFSTSSPEARCSGFGPVHDLPSHAEAVIESLDDIPVYDPNDAADSSHNHLLVGPSSCTSAATTPPAGAKCLRMLKDKSLRAHPRRCHVRPRRAVPNTARLHARGTTRSPTAPSTGASSPDAPRPPSPMPSRALRSRPSSAYLLLALQRRLEQIKTTHCGCMLGLAIKMALTSACRRTERGGIKFHGGQDPWYTRNWVRKATSENGDVESDHENEDDRAEPRGAASRLGRNVSDTFWCVFILDRVISPRGRAGR